MSRVFGIALALSTATHLAAVGLGASTAQPPPAARAALALTLVPPAAPRSTAFAIVTTTATQPAPHPEQRVAARKPESIPPPSTPRQPSITNAPTTTAHATAGIATSGTAEPVASEEIPQGDIPSDALMQQIQSLLSGHFHYPRLARKHGWEGIVEITLNLAPDGNISQVRLHRASGHAVLDNAALDSANQLRAIPNATIILRGRTRTMIVPIHYRLRES